MKFLIRQDGQNFSVIATGDNFDISTLADGVYLIAKSKESIIVRSSGRAQNHQPTNNPATPANVVDISGFRNAPPAPSKAPNLAPPVADPDFSKPANPFEQMKTGVVKWIDGLRYCLKGSNEIERLPSSQEPLMVEGKKFSGQILEGVPVWATVKETAPQETKQEIPKEAKQEAKSDKPKKNKKVDASDLQDILDGKVDPFADFSNATPAATSTTPTTATTVTNKEEFDAEDFLANMDSDPVSKPKSLEKEGDCFVENGTVLVYIHDNHKYAKSFSDKQKAERSRDLIANMTREKILGFINSGKFTKTPL